MNKRKRVSPITTRITAIPDDAGSYSSENDTSPLFVQYREEIEEEEAARLRKEYEDFDDDEPVFRNSVDPEAYIMRTIMNGDGDILGY